MDRLILVADDEEKIATLVEEYLKAAGFRTLRASDGLTALRLFREKSPDLLVLDIGMPGMDGLDLAREIRKSSSAPIVFLSARTDETDRIVGLEIGADDYVPKPFSPRELTARVKAILRRVAPGGEARARPDRVSVGVVELDPKKREVRTGGVKRELTAAQFDILALLMSEPGRVFTRSDILEAVAGTTFEGYERTIDAHIKNIRKALGDDGAEPRFIGTVRGIGYKFLEPGDVPEATRA